MCHCGVSESINKGKVSMSEVTMIGIDLAKRVFQLHGACANGMVVFRKKLTRIQLLAFMRSADVRQSKLWMVPKS